MGRSYDTVQYPFIEVICSNGTVLTKSSANYRSNSRGLVGGSRPDYFVSLSHKRYVDDANTFTFNFNFVPNDASGKGPNWFEQQLLQSTGHIKFRYGLDTKDPSTWSPFYFGFINTYSCNFSNGCLKYTVQGISSSVIANLDDIKDHDYYYIHKDGDSKDTAKTVLDKMEKLVNEGSSLKDYYVFDRKRSSDNFEVKDNVTSDNINPMTFLKKIAKSIVDKEDSSTYFYKVIVDDTERKDRKGTISLRRYSHDKISAVYTFDWGSKDCDVIDWSPSFDGSTFLIFSRNEKSKIKKQYAVTSDNQGNPAGGGVDKTDEDDLTSKFAKLYNFDDSVSEAVTDLSSLLEATNYVYQATIRVLGLAGSKAEGLALVESNVAVNPLINGKPHHSQGIYMVNSIEDNVSSGGFTTTLGLQRKSDIKGNEIGTYTVKN